MEKIEACNVEEALRISIVDLGRRDGGGNSCSCSWPALAGGGAERRRCTTKEEKSG